jgi:hypothetical protein
MSRPPSFLDWLLAVAIIPAAALALGNWVIKRPGSGEDTEVIVLGLIVLVPVLAAGWIGRRRSDRAMVLLSGAALVGMLVALMFLIGAGYKD